jgi:hypothetical protein
MIFRVLQATGSTASASSLKSTTPRPPRGRGRR